MARVGEASCCVTPLVGAARPAGTSSALCPLRCDHLGGDASCLRGTATPVVTQTVLVPTPGPQAQLEVIREKRRQCTCFLGKRCLSEMISDI